MQYMCNEKVKVGDTLDTKNLIKLYIL